ncbi:hypothetical protein CQW23_10041 [Capsicum baccatum]|uniref:Uncharacterized protein n=1 Tax=Capsicum baccatum TaxID=33114 RepID=A0A2G2WYH0_CAPBA|nr:hypothetical protein CQW23_10041 [Capsicum baccatum]
MTSKRGVIPSNRILYPDTPLEIKVAKRRRKDASKESSIIEKGKITTPLSLSYIDVQCAKATREQHMLKNVNVDVIVETTAEEHNITVDNPSTVAKDEEKVEPVHTDWSTIEAYRYKMANPFDVQYGNGIAQPTIGSLNYSPFIVTCAKYLSDRLQVPNYGLDTGLLCKRYAALLWKYGEAKGLKPYATDVKDTRRSKQNFVEPDEEQLVHVD